MDELIRKLSRMTDEFTVARDEALSQAQTEAGRAQSEAERSQTEARERAAAEDEVARLRAELDALKKS